MTKTDLHYHTAIVPLEHIHEIFNQYLVFIEAMPEGHEFVGVIPSLDYDEADETVAFQFYTKKANMQ